MPTEKRRQEVQSESRKPAGDWASSSRKANRAESNKLVQEKRLGSENSESWDLRDLRTSCEGNTSLMGSPGPKD